jgi:hypothetical protein
MPGYYRALAERRETEWYEALDEEIDALSEGWTPEEIGEFCRIAREEIRVIQIEMRLSGAEAVYDRFGVTLPTRQPLYIAAMVALVLGVVILAALIVRR